MIGKGMVIGEGGDGVHTHLPSHSYYYVSIGFNITVMISIILK